MGTVSTVQQREAAPSFVWQCRQFKSRSIRALLNHWLLRHADVEAYENLTGEQW